MTKMMRGERLILVEDLIGALEDGIDDLDLPPSVGDGLGGISAHQGRAKDDGEVVRVHAVDVGVVHDAGQMQTESTEGGIVWIREVVDDGMEGVSAYNVIIVFWQRGRRRLVGS